MKLPIDATARLPLLRLPTPLHRLQARSAWLTSEVEVWAKRDDEGSCTLTGTKARKLEFLLGDALERDSRTVLTCGGFNSNHCRATALSAAVAQLECHLVLRRPPEDLVPHLIGNLSLMQLAGAHIHWIDPADYDRRSSIMHDIAQTLDRCYVIPEGGSSTVGMLGCVAAGVECSEQAAAMNWKPDVVVHALSSGGTTAGLACGLSVAGASTRVLSIDVTGSPGQYRHTVRTLISSAQAWCDSNPWDILEGFAGSGYAIPSRISEHAATRMAKHEGIVLDATYTAKAFSAVEQLVQSGRIPAGSRVLFWHTGGVFGRFDGHRDSQNATAFESMNQCQE